MFQQIEEFREIKITLYNHIIALRHNIYWQMLGRIKYSFTLAYDSYCKLLIVVEDLLIEKAQMQKENAILLEKLQDLTLKLDTSKISFEKERGMFWQELMKKDKKIKELIVKIESI